jgi:hypothetical protein
LKLEFVWSRRRHRIRLCPAWHRHVGDGLCL